MREPDIILFNALSALAAVRDLLLCLSGSGDLHHCDPENLCCLLEVIHNDLKRAAEGYEALSKAA